jgi:hypothetical protein
MKDRSLAALMNAAQIACADVLAIAPMTNSDRIRELAGKPGAHFAITVTPGGMTIHLVAAAERARVFAYGDVGDTFQLSEAV